MEQRVEELKKAAGMIKIKIKIKIKKKAAGAKSRGAKKAAGKSLYPWPDCP